MIMSKSKSKKKQIAIDSLPVGIIPCGPFSGTSIVRESSSKARDSITFSHPFQSGLSENETENGDIKHSPKNQNIAWLPSPISEIGLCDSSPSARDTFDKDAPPQDTNLPKRARRRVSFQAIPQSIAFDGYPGKSRSFQRKTSISRTSKIKHQQLFPQPQPLASDHVEQDMMDSS
jgi:hypothetical protein